MEYPSASVQATPGSATLRPPENRAAKPCISRSPSATESFPGRPDAGSVGLAKFHAGWIRDPFQCRALVFPLTIRLPELNYDLLTIHYPLHIVNCALLIVNCSLLIDLYLPIRHNKGLMVIFAVPAKRRKLKFLKDVGFIG